MYVWSVEEGAGSSCVVSMYVCGLWRRELVHRVWSLCMCVVCGGGSWFTVCGLYVSVWSVEEGAGSPRVVSMYVCGLWRRELVCHGVSGASVSGDVCILYH